MIHRLGRGPQVTRGQSSSGLESRAQKMCGLYNVTEVKIRLYTETGVLVIRKAWVFLQP